MTLSGWRWPSQKLGMVPGEELAPGEAQEVGPVRITATPADHPGFRPPFGPRGTAVGYLIESGQARLYFAGDTDLIPEMETMIEGELDVAFLPISGWGPRLGPGHMNPARAAEAVVRLGPRYAVPIHWGTLWPYGLGRFTADGWRVPRRSSSAASKSERARRMPEP